MLDDKTIQPAVARLVAAATTHSQVVPIPRNTGSHHESDLVHMALLRLDAATQLPDDVADLLDPLGLAQSHGAFLISVHTVFPYGEAPAPSYNPLRLQGNLQGFASLASVPTAI